MSYMCMGCMEVYDRSLGYCPKPICGCEVVHVDELMLPTIRILNQKGFITSNCCSGHVYDDGCSIYISFCEFITAFVEIDEIKEAFKGLPENWTLSFEDDGSFVIRYMLTQDLENEFAAYEEILNENLKLLEFVDTLPYLDY